MKSLIAHVLVAALFLSGCKLTKPSSNHESGSRSNQLGGNGEAYSGIIKKTYFDIVPNYKCRNANGDLVPSYRSRLTVDTDGSVSYGRDLCSPSETRISRDEVHMSATQLVSDYDKALYQYFESDPLSPSNTQTIMWCETTSASPSGYEFLLGQKPSGTYQVSLFEVKNGVAGPAKIFSASYLSDPSKRVVTSTDPSVSFSANIGFSTVTIGSDGYSGQGFMYYPSGVKRAVTCHFNY